MNPEKAKSELVKESKEKGILGIILGLTPILFIILGIFFEGTDFFYSLLFLFHIYFFIFAIPIFLWSFAVSVDALTKDKNIVSILAILSTFSPVIGLLVIYFLSFKQYMKDFICILLIFANIIAIYLLVVLFQKKKKEDFHISFSYKIVFVILSVSLIFLSYGFYLTKSVSYPEFVNVSFSNFQPAEGDIVFKDDGYMYSSNEDKQYKEKYSYNKHNQIITTKTQVIKIIHYDKKVHYVFAHRKNSFMAGEKPIVYRNSNLETYFTDSDDRLDFVNPVILDRFTLNIDGTVQSSDSIVYTVTKACLKNTEICNFYHIKGSNQTSYIYEKYDGNYVEVS